MITEIRFKKGLGVPPSLKYGEPAVDMMNKILYIGMTDAEEGGSDFLKIVDEEAIKKILAETTLNSDLITSGSGENSIIINDLENKAEGKYSFAKGYGTQAVGPYTSAGGYNTIAGIKGYFFQNIEFGEEIFNEDGTSTETYGPCIITLTKEQPDDITLAPVPESFEIGLVAGDVITLDNGDLYPRCGTIVSVDNNVITVDSLPFNFVENMAEKTGMSNYQIFCPDKPLVGEIPLGYCAHAEGEESWALEIGSHAEGVGTRAEGMYSHAEGIRTVAEYSSHAEGYRTKAWMVSHAEGVETKADGGQGAHSEGVKTHAAGVNGSHAEGCKTVASGEVAHAEGYYANASGDYSHAENRAIASGLYSHAQGYESEANAAYTHAEGYRTIASSLYQHVQGLYNIEDSENRYADIIGNGTASSASKRKNIQTTDWNGNVWTAGNIYVGGKNQDDGKLVATDGDLQGLKSNVVDYVKFTTNATDESIIVTYEVDKNETYMTANDNTLKSQLDTEDNNTFYYYYGTFEVASKMVFPAGTYNITAKLLKRYSSRKITATIMDLEGNIIVSSGEKQVATYLSTDVSITSKSQFGDTDFGTFVLDKPWTISFKTSSGGIGMSSFTITGNGKKVATEEVVDIKVSEAIANIDMPSLENYATKGYVDNAISNAEISGGNTSGDNPQILSFINNLHYYCNKDIVYDESLFVISGGVLTIDCSGIVDGKLVIPYNLGTHTSIAVLIPENITKIIIPRGMNLVNEKNMTDEDLVAMFTNIKTIVRIHEDGAVLSFDISEGAMN